MKFLKKYLEYLNNTIFSLEQNDFEWEYDTIIIDFYFIEINIYI